MEFSKGLTQTSDLENKLRLIESPKICMENSDNHKDLKNDREWLRKK